MKTVIFDLDGTLLNTIDTIAYYCNRALTKYGFNEISTERYKKIVGNGARLLVERALNETGGWSGPDFDAVFKEYNALYDADTLYLTEPYPGIVDMLGELKASGFKIAVLSNKPDFATNDVVGTIFGKDTFDLVRGAVEGVPLKPAPDAVYDIMSALGAAPEETVFVGDTKVDIETGKNAGLYSIGVLWGFRDEAELSEAGADVIIDNPADIIEIAKQHNA